MRCGVILLLIACLGMLVTAKETGNQASLSRAQAAGGRLIPAVDVPGGFCCQDYLVLIADRIRANWDDQVPAAGTTILRLTIRRDGRIADSVIEQPSGAATLDSAAQRAVALTRELPSLPEGYPNATLTIHLTFEYGGSVGSLGAALRNLQRERQNEGSGSFGPEIQFDTKGVEFGPWIKQFVAQVRRNWFIPFAAMSSNGHVVVQFNVHKGGAITDLTVVGPCLVDAFNKSAFGALAASNPTRPLPPEYRDEKAFFTVTFYYNEAPPQSEKTLQPNTPKLLVSPLPLPDEPASSLLNAIAADVEQRIGKPAQIDGYRWTYKTPHGALAVYFDDAGVVIDIQPRAFDLSIFKK
jgi:TonB family protein